MDDQLTLVDTPEEPPIKLPRYKGNRDADYHRIHIKGRRVLCHDCTDLIHEIGIVMAPLPGTARWRRTDQDGTIRQLCHAHADRRRREESKKKQRERE